MEDSNEGVDDDEDEEDGEGSEEGGEGDKEMDEEEEQKEALGDDESGKFYACCLCRRKGYLKRQDSEVRSVRILFHPDPLFIQSNPTF